MTSYTISHTCGHSMLLPLASTRDENERMVAWLEAIVCQTCHATMRPPLILGSDTWVVHQWRVSELAHWQRMSPTDMSARLIGRTIGDLFYPLLSVYLDQLTPSQSAILDFNGVTMDACFADAAFGPLIMSRARHILRHGCFLIERLFGDDLDHLEMALISRAVRYRLKNSVVPVRTDQGVILIGQCEPVVRETFLILTRYQQVVQQWASGVTIHYELTPEDLASMLKIHVAEAKARLHTLFALGLATRIPEALVGGDRDRLPVTNADGDEATTPFIYVWPF